MKRIRKRKKYKKALIIMLLLANSFTISLTYAKYVSETGSSDEIRVAKFGKLTLTEKLNGEVQINNSETITTVNYEINPGVNIDKEVYLEYVDTEVSTYLFLIIDSINWTYNSINKEFNILNNNTSLLSFKINSNWNYLENLSDENKFIFYDEFDINDDTTTKYEIMNQINTGLITSNDLEILNNSQIKFSVYSIQKNAEMTAEESWNYLNIE